MTFCDSFEEDVTLLNQHFIQVSEKFGIYDILNSGKNESNEISIHDINGSEAKIWDRILYSVINTNNQSDYSCLKNLH